MAKTRMSRRKQVKQIKKKKSKIRLTISTIFLLFFVITIGFAYNQYMEGMNIAEGKNNIIPSSATDNSDGQHDEDFSGQKDELGRINVLLLGVDSKKTKGARTDTIMIAQYDPKNKKAKIASIMRDSYVEIPGYKNNKINSAFSNGGPELLRQTIKENFGIDVQYYSLVNFDGFTDLVDEVAPDGIEINVEKRMRYIDNAGGVNIHLDPGLQRLDGENLLDYARFRHDSESDFGRVRRQQQVIDAVKEELVSLKGISQIPKMVGFMQPYIETNLDSKDVTVITSKFLVNPVNKIESLRIPVDGSYSNKAYPHAGSVLSLDIEENKRALQQFFNGAEEERTALSPTTDKHS